MFKEKIKHSAQFSFLLSMFIFGTIGIVVKSLGLPSGFVAASRGIIGALTIFIVILAMKKRPDKESIKNNLLPLVASGICIGINWVLLFESYRYTTVAVATLCYYMAPVFVVVLTPLVLRVKVRLAGWICVMLALIGMVLVSEPWSVGESGGAVGILLALGAAAFYASVTFINKKMKEISPYDTTVVQLLCAAAVVFIYSLVCEQVTLNMFTLPAILILLLIGIVHTGVAYTLFFGSVSRLSSERVALFSYIDPIVAVLLSALLLNEKMTIFTIIGAIIIIASTVALELVPKKSKE